MNMYTKLIMEWLHVDVATAMKIQDRMGCNGVDFSESSDRILKKAAKEAYAELQGV